MGRAVETELSASLADPLTRHADRLQERVERFVQSAGAAFGVDLPPPPDFRQDLSIPPIRIETVDEPGAVAMGSASCGNTCLAPSGTAGESATGRSALGRMLIGSQGGCATRRPRLSTQRRGHGRVTSTAVGVRSATL